MTQTTNISRIGIVGAGQMGQGIAHVCVLKGFEIQFYDSDSRAVTKAVADIGASMERQVRKGVLEAHQKTEACGRLSRVDDLADLGDCDVIIEAVTENEKVKRKIFKALAPCVKPETLIASNTSSISITRLATATHHPERFIGMHFMNPVPVMKLIEVIRGLQTSDETYREICALASVLDKTVADAQDFPAFIVNRIVIPMINEAVYTLYEGVGSVESIDTAMRLGVNHPMGPLELADFIGLDVCLSVMQILFEGLADSKYRPCPLLAKYVEAGWHGRKSGRGFYDYSGEVPRPTR